MLWERTSTVTRCLCLMDVKGNTTTCLLTGCVHFLQTFIFHCLIILKGGSPKPDTTKPQFVTTTSVAWPGNHLILANVIITQLTSRLKTISSALTLHWQPYLSVWLALSELKARLVVSCLHQPTYYSYLHQKWSLTSIAGFFWVGTPHDCFLPQATPGAITITITIASAQHY